MVASVAQKAEAKAKSKVGAAATAIEKEIADAKANAVVAAVLYALGHPVQLDQTRHLLDWGHPVQWERL